MNRIDFSERTLSDRHIFEPSPLGVADLDALLRSDSSRCEASRRVALLSSTLLWTRDRKL